MSKPRTTDSHLTAMVIHTKGQRDRLSNANRHQTEDILALTAVLRDVYAILQARTVRLTDGERVQSASNYIAEVLRGFGGVALPESCSQQDTQS